MGYTNIGLLENTLKCYKNSNYYIYGTFGQKLTTTLVEAKIKQYPSFYRTTERINNARKAVGKYEYAYDCVGLIKSYLFGGIGNVKYNSAYDKSANGMYNASKEKGAIASIPSIKGLLVWMDGHIGIYDGEKYTYECTVSSGSFKIIKTVAKTRGWTNWCKCPYIAYETENQKTQLQTTKSIVDLANEVIEGKYGVGEARKQALGSLYNEVQAKVNEILGVKKTANTYYPACNSKYTSIVEALNSIGIDSSYANRKRIAVKNNIVNYTGTAQQNIQMLDRLKAGKLIRV